MSDLDTIREEELDGDTFVTHWSDLETRWGQAEEFALRMDGVDVPGFPPAFTPTEFSKREAPPWLIPGVVPSGLTAFFGPTNSGKTFIALDAGLALATGLVWAGEQLQQVNVMYFLAEGQGEASNRVEAWCQNRSASLSDLDGKFWIVPQRLPLGGITPDGVNMAVVATRLNVGLIVLDTWARTLEGDENSNTDVSRTVNLLTDIRANSDISVWVIHHTGYTSDSRMRGASAFAAALDCEIAIAGHLQDPAAPHVELNCTKQRDAAYFEPFCLDVVECGSSITFAPEPRTPAEADTMEGNVETDIVRLLGLGPRAKKDLAGSLGKSESGIRAPLERLVDTGVVERIGTGSTTRYRMRGA